MCCVRYVLPLVVCAQLVACDDPGGTSGITADATLTSETSQATDAAVASDVPDTMTSATDTATTAPPEDTWVAPDTTLVDTGPDDTGASPEVIEDTWVAPDTTTTDTGAVPDSSVAEDSSVAPDTTTPPGDTSETCDCPPVGAGPIGVVITNNTTATPPVLDGLLGDATMSGTYELDSVTVYTKGAFDGVLITGATVADAGQTSGTASFIDDTWAFYLDLDLTFSAQTIIGPQGGDSRNQIEGGGCFTIDGNDIVSDTSACADGWPTGTSPPTSAEFEHDDATGAFTLKIVLDKQFVLALIPEEYQGIAASAIKGPITFVAALVAAD
ncbi:MAG: hypothetical protein IT385_30065 [Deltaproteobacteria bacterium]|nr:hypothetical protein [Deltaproteobacteria bacterium]